MIKTIIIDDEPLARTIIKDYLSKHEDFTIVQECNDGFEGVKAIQQHQPELIFLDIQMPKINGFEMLELIEQPPGVIFTTAFDEYAIKAFDSLAIDYLLKPFSKERFDKAVQKWKDQRHLHLLAEQLQRSFRVFGAVLCKSLPSRHRAAHEPQLLHPGHAHPVRVWQPVHEFFSRSFCLQSGSRARCIKKVIINDSSETSLFSGCFVKDMYPEFDYTIEVFSC